MSVWTQQAYIKASNTGGSDTFGTSVALSNDGSTLAVGARSEASNATGIGGNQASNTASGAGAVYAFTRSAGVWSQEAYIKASNTESNDSFGGSLALAANGNTLVVSAYQEDSAATGIGGNQADNTASGSGAVYVFVRSLAVWSQQAYIKASNTDSGDAFGGSLDLSGDGNTLIAGAYQERSGATGINGNQALNATTSAGAAYVFKRSVSTWTQLAYVKASNTGMSDVFGSSVAISSDATTLASGATGEASNATGVGGDQSDNSVTNAGAVYVFTIP